MTRIVVAGISTRVGKTLFSAILVEALNGYYWKPVQCGLPADRDWVAAQLSLKERCFPEDVALNTPCSPHLAAKIEGKVIEAAHLVPPDCSGPLVIEGTGGLLTPLNETETWVDAALAWDAQWILVHRHYLGSLNHCLLTLEGICSRGIRLRGIVFIGNGDRATEEMLLKKGKTICIGRIGWQEALTPEYVQRFAKQLNPHLHMFLGQ